jgi:hypothetical protein
MTSTLFPTFAVIPSTPTPGIPCPNGGVVVGSQCQYTYDRQKAVDYAVKYSEFANPLFCRFNNPGAGISCGWSGGDSPTDCSNFVSQSLLYAGLPMTQYIDDLTSYSESISANNARWVCRRDTSGVCIRLSNAGNWAGAYNQLLPAYIANLMSPPLVPITPNILPMSQSSPTVFNATFVSTQVRNAGIVRGDLLYLNVPISSGIFPHVALIVGWGPFHKLWDNNTLSASNSLYWFEPTYDAAKIKYSQNNLSETTIPIVPYIVDHGPQGANNVNWPFISYSKPRPYYFLWWIPPPFFPPPDDNEYNYYYLNKTISPTFIKVSDEVNFPMGEKIVVESPYTSIQVWRGYP